MDTFFADIHLRIVFNLELLYQIFKFNNELFYFEKIIFS